MLRDALRSGLGLVLLLLLAVTSSPSLQAQTGELTGRITDAETGSPLSVASVQALGAETRGTVTDADGEFRFTLPPGTYALVVSLIGYEPQRLDGLLRCRWRGRDGRAGPALPCAGTEPDRGHGWARGRTEGR